MKHILSKTKEHMHGHVLCRSGVMDHPDRGDSYIFEAIS